jgi:hypothetical protein
MSATVEQLTPEQIAELGKQFAESLCADWKEITTQHGLDAVSLSLETGDANEPDRAETESSDPVVDAIIDRSSAAGVIIADEVRRAVQIAVKKKFPGLKS